MLIPWISHCFLVHGGGEKKQRHPKKAIKAPYYSSSVWCFAYLQGLEVAIRALESDLNMAALEIFFRKRGISRKWKYSHDGAPQFTQQFLKAHLLL